MQLTLLFDMDGVITDLPTKWVRRYNELYDDDLARDDFVAEWGGFNERIKPEAKDKVYDILKEPCFFDDLSEMPGAIGGFENFCADDRYDCYIVTAFSGHPEIAHGKLIWVTQNLPFFDSERMVLTKQKHLIDGNVLIDDSVQNLEKWVQAQFSRNGSAVIGGGCDAIAFAAPHNDGCVATNPLINARVASWDELSDYVNSMVAV